MKKTVEMFDHRDRKWSMIDDLDPVDDTQEGLGNLLVCANWPSYAWVVTLGRHKMAIFLPFFHLKNAKTQK